MTIRVFQNVIGIFTDNEYHVTDLIVINGIEYFVIYRREFLERQYGTKYAYLLMAEKTAD